MEITGLTATISVIAGVSSLSIGAISAAISWYEKAAESRRSRCEKRHLEIQRLICRFKEIEEVFIVKIDYASSEDDHLRIADDVFNQEEVNTRLCVDKAFEHLREVHTSVRLKLIAKNDLGHWIYWIYRSISRPPLREFAKACGYMTFMNDLIEWTVKSNEYKELARECPYIGISHVKEQRIKVKP